MGKKTIVVSVILMLILITTIVWFSAKDNGSVHQELYDPNVKPTVGLVELHVSDLNKMGTFYKEVIGFTELHKDDGSITLGVNAETPLLQLIEENEGEQRPRNTTGLFHFAILLPERSDLGAFILNSASRGYLLDGASDHIYSEAVYLSDPDGNGIEVYVDKEPKEWEKDENGKYITGTFPMDADGVLSAAKNKNWDGLPKGTQMGHMHLQVSDLKNSEEFYVDALGFDIKTKDRGYLFVAKDNYHHHIGMNVWAGTGLPSPSEKAWGLSFYTLHFTEDDYDHTKQQLDHMGYTYQENDGEILVKDPSDILIKIVKQ